MLHGAGGTARGGIEPFLEPAERANLILVSPRSRGRTWDAVGDLPRVDAPLIDRVLGETMGRYAVDPARVAVTGFSDGRLPRPDPRSGQRRSVRRDHRLLPGLSGRTSRPRPPRIFISHGVADEVLPIDRCSRRIVPELREEGYDVRYEEFAGGHEIPPPIVAAAVGWLADPAA